jgi:hypothetical protein
MYNAIMGEDTQPKISKTNILKKEAKLSWLFKFLLIAGFMFVTIVFIGVVYTNITDNKKESLRLQKEIEELKYRTNKQNITSTTSPQVQQPIVPQPRVSQPVVVQDSDPVIDCNASECGTLKIKRSECSVGTCCEIGDDWVWTKSEIECRDAQDKNYDREKATEHEKNQAESDVENSNLYFECTKKARESKDDCYEECSKIHEGNATALWDCQGNCDSNYKWTLDICK